MDVVGQDSVDDFRDDDRQLRLGVNGWQLAAQPVEGDRHAEQLVAVTVDGHPDVVQCEPEQDDDARVILGHCVIGDAVGLDVSFDQQPQQRVAMVHHGADVYWPMVVDRGAA